MRSPLPLLLAVSLTGAALVSATPAGAAQDPPPADRGVPAADPDAATIPGPQEGPDARATARLSSLLTRIQGLEDVTVAVEGGVARLSGTVSSVDARERAAALAAQEEGVAAVDNRLVVDATLTEQLEPALSRVRQRLSGGVAYLPLLAVAGSVFLAFAVLAFWVGRWTALFERLSGNPFVRNLLRQAVRAILLLLGLLVAVEILGLTTLVGAVLGTAGIAGVVLGFAFKDIVENYLAGVLLSLRQPFAPNDDVAIADHRGKVVRLTSRETILMSPDGNHVRIPNAAVFRGVMVNYTRNPLRRFEVRLTVAPDSDLLAALEVGVTVLGRMEGTLDHPPPGGRVVEVGESWVGLAWSGWMDQDHADFLKVRSEAVRLVLEGLTAAGVDMPPPEHRVRVVREGLRPPTREGPPPGPQLDVSVDTAVDQQIAEERRASPETDLLEPGGS